MKKYLLGLVILSILLFLNHSILQAKTPEEILLECVNHSEDNITIKAPVDWFGYKMFELTFQGRAGKVVVPQNVAEGLPWIWRARFWGHEPQTDLALLKLGFHVCYIDSAPMLGSPDSVALWQNYYLFLTNKLGLAKKANLEGMSRGGLYVTNWAVRYPEQVASIYIDNPVLDFKSWPGGFGKASQTVSEWQNVLKYYKYTEQEALASKVNPVDNAEFLAKKKVPILILCADADTAVPWEENTKIFKERYEKIGGPLKVIMKKGYDHHPHSLPDPKPIVDFILEHQN